MPLPASVNETIVFGHVLDFNGDPIAGVTVTAKPSITRLVIHTTDDIIYPAVVESDLTDIDGAFDIKLIASDDPDTDPTNWSWSFTLVGPGVNDTFTSVNVPFDAPEDPAFADQPAIKLVALVNGGSGEGAPFKLADLFDVDLLPLPTDGQLLTFNSTTQKWEPQSPEAVATVDWDNVLDKPTEFTPVAHTHALANATDVDLTAIATGQVLEWDGSAFVNVDILDVDGLQSVLDGKTDVGHEHVVDDISNISQVGKTGEYADLLSIPNYDDMYVSIGTPLFKPTLPSIGVEKMMWGGTSTHGFVNVGTGGIVDINDTTDFAIGVKSISLTSTTGSATDVAAGAGGLTPIDVEGLVPVIWLKVENLEAITTLRLWVGEGVSPNAYVWEIKESSDWPWVSDASGAAAGEGWYRISLPYGKTILNASAPDLSVINYIRLEMSGDATGTAVVHWGGLGFAEIQDQYANGVITLRMDDLYASQYEVVAPYLDRYGYSASAYAIAQVFKEGTGIWTDRMSLDDAHKLEELHGWEICAHADSSAVHNQIANQGGLGDVGYTAYTSDAQLLDMYACRQYLFNNGFRSPHHFAYPQGAWDETTRANVRSLFTTGMTFNCPTYETLPVSEPTKVRCVQIVDTMTLANVQAIVDAIKAGKEWGVLAFHDIVTTPATANEWPIADFEDLIDYIFAQGIPVRLVSEVVK